MKIYNFWQQSTLSDDGRTIQFKAGSNDSPEHAQEIIRQKIDLYYRLKTGETMSPEDVAFERSKFSETPEGMEYEAPICEEVCEVLDEHNIVTRNRYGALVLNSDNHFFVDVDAQLTWSLGAFFKSLLGISKSPKTETLERILNTILHSPLKGSRMRIYETCKGYRLLIHGNSFSANGDEAQNIMQQLQADALYASLCAKQNCFRARLTPKPARIKMRTMLKFRFPYDAALRSAIDAWLDEYERKSANYAVCRFVSSIGPAFMDPVIEYHDKLCGCHEGNLPLA